MVIEEIRHEVAEGFQRLSRGGIEVGGVLYGTRDGRTVRVLAMRPIACEHARGPGFLFSDKDRVALNDQLLRDKDDPQLEGSDLGRLVSVAHPQRDRADGIGSGDLFHLLPRPLAGDAGGASRPRRHACARDFSCARPTARCAASGAISSSIFRIAWRECWICRSVLRVIGRRAKIRSVERPRCIEANRWESRPGGATGVASAPAMTRRESPVVVPSFDQGPQLLPPQPARRKWPWLLAWALVLVAAIVFGLRYWMSSAPEPIALTVVERNGELQIEWNRAAKPVASAVRGSLQIMDGPDSRTVALTPQALASGKFAYQRKSGDIEVRMTVENAEGGKSLEASQFLGHPPAAAAPPAAAPAPPVAAAPAPAVSPEVVELQKRRDELEGEVQRLHRENASQADKIRQHRAHPAGSRNPTEHRQAVGCCNLSRYNFRKSALASFRRSNCFSASLNARVCTQRRAPLCSAGWRRCSIS